MPVYTRHAYARPYRCLTCMGEHRCEAERMACRRCPRGTIQRVRVRELLEALEAERRKA